MACDLYVMCVFAIHALRLISEAQGGALYIKTSVRVEKRWLSAPQPSGDGRYECRALLGGYLLTSRTDTSAESYRLAP